MEEQMEQIMKLEAELASRRLVGETVGKTSDETAILVGAAPLGAESEYIERCIGEEQAYTIAVDGGIAFFYERNMLPDFWLGDMDSVSAVIREEMIEKMPPQCVCQVPVMKDDTDMALAVKNAWERGIRNVLMFGAMGGKRSSHSFANVQLMLHYAKKGCRIQSISANMRMEVLYHGEKKFEADEKGLVSVLALTDCAKGVLLKGLKYEYCGDLTNDVALGVSNAFVGKEACIAVGDGGLLLIYEEEG